MGAGIGGLTTAAILQMRGINVRILEKRKSLPTEGDTLFLQHQMGEVFEQLGLDPRAQSPFRNDSRTKDLIPIRRGQLIEHLHGLLAPGSVEYGAKVDFVDRNGRPTAFLADGTNIASDVLINATGRHGYQLTDQELQYAGFVMCHGNTHVGDIPRSARRMGEYKQATPGVAIIGNVRKNMPVIEWFVSVNVPKDGLAKLLGEIEPGRHYKSDQLYELTKQWFVGAALARGPFVASLVANAPDLSVTPMSHARPVDRLLQETPNGAIIELGDRAHPLLPQLAPGANLAASGGLFVGAAVPAMVGPNWHDELRQNMVKAEGTVLDLAHFSWKTGHDDARLRGLDSPEWSAHTPEPAFDVRTFKPDAGLTI